MTVRILLGLVIMVGQQAAFANERWYQIEVIVMEHKDKAGLLLEEWPINPGYPKTAHAHNLQKYLEGEAPPENYIELPEQAFKLDEAKKNIVKRTGNKILWHNAWRQKVKENAPEPIHIFGGKTFTNPNGSDQQTEFDGTLTVFLSRYLHVSTDLIFHKPMAFIAKDSSYAHQDLHKVKPLSSSDHWPTQANTGLQGFRLLEKRKVKKDEVTYIDHPLYGIMIRITDDKTPT